MPTMDKFFDLAESNPTLEQVNAYLADLRAQMDAGSGVAAFELSQLVSKGCVVWSAEIAKQIAISESEERELQLHTFRLLTQNAGEGNGNAMYLLGMYYQTGMEPAEVNILEWIAWLEKALAAGYLPAASELKVIYLSCKDHLDANRAKLMRDIIDGRVGAPGGTGPVTLSDRDASLILDLLDNPPEANAKLSAAVAALPQVPE